MGGSSSITGGQTIYHTDNLCFDGTDRGAPMAADGQLWIGATASNRANDGGHVRLGTLTAGTGVTITNGPGTIAISLTGGGVAVEHLTGNTGGVLNPDGSNNFNIITANTTVKFSGSGSTLTQDFSLTNLSLGSSLPALTSGVNNLSVGSLVLNTLTSGQQNTSIGTASGRNITSGQANTFLGYGSGNLISTTSQNTYIGGSSGTSATGGTGNTACGQASLNSLLNGSSNIAIGLSAGNNYSGSESSNIIIGNTGTLGESNKIRIGTSGSGAGQQNACFIVGIDGVNVGSVAKIVTLASDQLGTATLTGGTGITITPGANTITINSTGGITWSVITADQTAAVDNGYICNKGSALLLALPATAAIGDTIRVTGINTALGWKITQAANQQIFFGNTSTTLGATGFLQSAATRDSVEIVCVVAGASTIYNVISSIGNITIA